MNLIRSTTDLAMHIVRAYAKAGHLLIDASCGNGHDTLQLARMEPGRLYAFDIQQDAVDNTRALLEENGFGEAIRSGRFRILRQGHEHMAEAIAADLCGGSAEEAKGCVHAVIFNLGYLPGGDKRITTCLETTLCAVRQAMDLLAKDGIICITMYSGHETGKKEKEALLALAEGLDSHIWHVSYVQMLNQHKAPPEILLITRKTR